MLHIGIMLYAQAICVCRLNISWNLVRLFANLIVCVLTAMKPHEIQEKLGLTRLRDRNWYVQPSCATTGDGLYEGLTWLTSNVRSWSEHHSGQVKTLFNQASLSSLYMPPDQTCKGLDLRFDCSLLTLSFQINRSGHDPVNVLHLQPFAVSSRYIIILLVWSPTLCISHIAVIILQCALHGILYSNSSLIMALTLYSCHRHN